MTTRLTLNDQSCFEARDLNVLAFGNWCDDLFSDAKISGVELIHHEVRTATNGDVRLSATPGQWDRTPALVDRRVDRETCSVVTSLAGQNEYVVDVAASYIFLVNAVNEVLNGA